MIKLDEIISAYSANKVIYKRLKKNVKHLLSAIIENGGEMPMHLITGRVKKKSSLKKKIELKGHKYESVSDITDIVGLRVICYLASEVDLIGELIEKEFVIDWENTVDKRKSKTNEFGYQSVHYIVSFKDDRYIQTEYKNFEGIKFEIQVRSILQHAWAEIEHDLGYKSAITIPSQLRRNFSRISALLESADLEFDRLNGELEKYTGEISLLILNEPEHVQIDRVSIEYLYNNNDVLIAAKHILNQYAAIRKEVNFYEPCIKGFYFLGFETLAQIEEALQIEATQFLRFFEALTFSQKHNYYKEVGALIEILYFQYYLAAKSESVEEITKYMIETGMVNSENEHSKAIFQGYIDLYKSLR